MKRHTVFMLFLLLAQVISAQTTPGFNYQALVRDSEGKVAQNTDVQFRIGIVSGDMQGPTLYQETHQVATDEYGQITLSVGNGSPVSGDFQNIDWANAPTFLKVELDLTGGTDYELMGITQLLSVPYALYAYSTDDEDPDPTNELQSWTNLPGIPENIDTDKTDDFSGQFSDLQNIPQGLSDGDDIEDADADPTNELELPEAPSAGDLAYFDGTAWQSLPVGDDNEVLVPAASGLTWKNLCEVLGPIGLPSSPFLPESDLPTCLGDIISFTTQPVSNAESYIWQVTGGNIISGQNTNTIVVEWTTEVGEICVQTENQCGASPSLCKAISALEAPLPPNIPTGFINPCLNDSETYSIEQVPNASDYSWSVSGGAILDGQGTRKVVVDWTGSNASLCVKSSNDCGTSEETCLNINIQESPILSEIPVGTTSAFLGDNETYSTTINHNASEYHWEVTGGQIQSGQGSNEIEVLWSSLNGEVCLTLRNNCGESDPSCLTVSIDLPGISMINVAAGSFDMGCTVEQSQSECMGDEFPVHNVSLSPFQIADTEVTQEQWLAIVPEYNPFSEEYGQSPDNPAHLINWFDAITFCNRLSIESGLTPVYYADASFTQVFDQIDGQGGTVYWNQNAYGFRLPTEAEWEYAARGAGTSPQTKYSGSDYIDEVAWYIDNSERKTQAIGTKASNAINTFDMSGNVFEWCWDGHDSNYYSSSPSVNPIGPSSSGARVRRGGSWNGIPPRCRVSDRIPALPTSRLLSTGLRLTRSINP